MNIKSKGTEESLKVAPPDESKDDINEKVGGLVEIFAFNVSMADSSEQ